MNPAPKTPDESTYAGRFAARLRMLREKKGLTVDVIVERMVAAGYSLGVQTYYGWENGKRQLNLDAIPAIAVALETSIANLFPKS